MSVIKITKENFEAEVARSPQKVLIDFWAAWCGPCRFVSPVIDQIANEVPDIKVGKINVDEEQELAMQFGIMSIPTIMVFKDGKVSKKTVGAVPKNAILDMLK